jgi:hypothetical protein
MTTIWPDILTAARNLRPEHLARLGITTDDALAAGGLGALKISTHQGGLFEPGGDLSAAIVPVYWGSIPSLGNPVADWELIDLLAFNPSNRDQWWLRRGDADLLGAGALDHLYLDTPLQIHRTPLNWLRSGAGGVVVLDWRTAASRLRSISTLIAEDIEHAKEVLNRLQTPLHIPEILVPEISIERAA